MRAHTSSQRTLRVEQCSGTNSPSSFWIVNANLNANLNAKKSTTFSRKTALLPQATCSVRLTAGCFGKLNMTDKENSKYSLSSCQCKAGKQFLPLVILSNVEGSRGNETSLYMCHFTSFRSREIATLALAMTTTLSLEQNKTKK